MTKGIKMNHLMEFCKNESCHQIEWDCESFHNILMKMNIGENIRALIFYSTSKCENRQSISTSKNLGITGFYHTVTKRLYNLSYCLNSSIEDYEEVGSIYEDRQTIPDLPMHLDAAVCKKLMKIFPEYSGQEIKSYDIKRCVDDAFFNSKAQEVDFQFHVSVDVNMCNKMLDGYLADPVAWIDSASDEILMDVDKLSSYRKKLDLYYLAKQELKNLINDKTNRKHRIKALRDCINDKNAVTVNFSRNGKKMTCKVETTALYDNSGKYSVKRHIAPSDRNLYEEIFEYGWVCIEDIENVQYNKKIIYKKF